jgi:hypothetical protein
MSEYSKQYYQEHKEEFAANRKEYKKNNPEVIKADAKRYYAKHKKRITAYSKKYYEEHKEKYAENRRLNHLKLAENAKKYYQEHKEKIKHYQQRRNHEIKKQVFEHYFVEIRCENCGIDNLLLLDIHHIDGDGGKHRKETSTTTGSSYHYQLIQEGYPILNVKCLCANCHRLEHWAD